MITKIVAFLLLACVAFTGCEKKEETPVAVESKVQTVSTEKEKAPSGSITLKTTTDETIKLTALPEGIDFEAYKGKVVMIDFFATWCPPCLAEMPHLNDIQTGFKDQVQIIGILMEESKSNSDIETFKQTHKIVFPITNSPENFQLADALGGIKSLPTTVIYDKNGSYFTHYVGAAPQEMIEADIRKALEK